MTHLLYRKHFLPLVCCLVGGLCFTACSDDDDTAAIPDTELTDAESNTAQELARLVHMLCEVDALPTGWATANFTPTVGEADDANPAVQKFAVADAVEALSYYNALTAQQLEAGTAADVWRCDGLGSLTFAALNAADCFATIDVDIKQVPQLKQIRLVPASALGDNAGGARLVGISVLGTKILAYVLCGLFAGLGGFVFASKYGQVMTVAGTGYEMTAIAACVLGGISLSGGLGNMIGAAIGAVIMSSISRLLVFIGLPSTYDNTITGVMLIVIVVVDALAQHRSVEMSRRKRLLSRTANSAAEGGSKA